MKTIEERAEIAIRECTTPYERAIGRDVPMVDGYIIGATEEHELLTRWHDPKKELPEFQQEVLLKMRRENGSTFHEIGWPAGHSVFTKYTPGAKVVAWRYIHE